MAVPDERMSALSSAIDKLMRHRLSEVHTVLPGRIVKYTQATQLADVEVCVKHRTPTDDGDEIVESFPIIPNVPIEQLQTVSFFGSFPVAVNDFVWLHIVEQSIDKWMDRGGVGVDDPIDRRFNLKDCYATLARNPKAPLSNTETDAIVIGHKTTGPRAYWTDTIIGLGAKAPSEFVALATQVLNQLNDIRTKFDAHVHTETGTTTSVPTVLMGAASSVAATKVKAV